MRSTSKRSLSDEFCFFAEPGASSLRSAKGLRQLLLLSPELFLFGLQGFDLLQQVFTRRAFHSCPDVLLVWNLGGGNGGGGINVCNSGAGGNRAELGNLNI